MRTIKLVFLAILMLAIVTLALANRGPVTLNLLPEGVGAILPLSIELPMFLVILASILTGLLIGYILEWLREHKHRRLAAEKQREAQRLSREVETLKKKHLSPEDEVLAILDKSTRNA
ncbi:LapA family protein [Halovulum dunhuangense]|uniref:LapA family protein n=1 Tax=Halovulum dunhuangense TaxID=1505036 RepID=A0A849L074_9RHOB|nr:LapA family protein [Halovulum dunhuangense]